MNEMEVVAKLYEAREGTITVIEYNGNFYDIRTKPEKEVWKIVRAEESEEPKKEIKKGLTQKTLDDFETKKELGKVLKRVKQVSLYENVYNEIKSRYDETKDDCSLHYRDIVKSYHPNIKQSSVDTYVWAYMKDIRGPLREVHFDEIKIESPKVKKTRIPKGNLVGCEGNNQLYDLPLNEIKQALLEHKSKQDLIEILRPYYAYAKPVTVRVYLDAYLRHIIKTTDSKLPFEYRYRGNKRKAEAEGIEYKPHKLHTRRIGKVFVKTYQIWIPKEDIQKVKTAIHKWNFVATTESIIKETGLEKHIVRASLNWLERKHEVYHGYRRLTPVYHPLPKEGGT